MVLAALIVRLVVVAQLADHPLLQPTGQLDTAVSVELGRRIAGGDLALTGATGPEPFFLAPLYAYFLGLVLALSGGSLLAAQLVQAGLGATAVGLLFLAARPWLGTRAALCAAALLAACGPVVFHETLLLQAALDPVLIALCLALVSRALVGGRGRDWLVAGGAMGLFALNRPNAVLWALALVLALPLAARSRAGVARAAAVALGLILAVAPATMRNLAVSGEPVLLTSHGGLNLYIGNNPEADGTYHHVPGITPDIRGQVRDARRVAETAEGRPLGAREVDAHFTRRTRDWAASHPGDALHLLLRKTAYVFSSREITLNYSYAYFSRDEPTLLRWLAVGAWLLVPFGLLGLADRLREAPSGADQGPVVPPTGFGLWALVVPVYALSVALFFISSRYRLPLLVPLAGGAGFALVRLATALRAREPRRLVGYAAALIPLFAVALWPWALDDGRGHAREDQVVHLVERGRVGDALTLLARAEPDHREPAVLLFRAGRALQAAGRAGEAIPLLERALAHAPGRLEVRYALGQCLLDEGSAAAAAPHLRAAYEGGVRPDLAGFDLARALASEGRVSEATVVLGRLVDLELDSRSRLTLARLAVELGAEELARRILERAAAEEPASAPVHLNLAVLLAREGRFEEARAEARRALELRPGYPQAQALLDRLQ